VKTRKLAYTPYERDVALIFKPNVFNNKPVDEAMIPFPTPLITPPDTRTYFILGSADMTVRIRDI
jgi:hypothetical protein